MPKQKKIGLALGGGGAKGFAHIGVINALEAAGIQCAIVSGTSIGALVGAVYAAGNLAGLQRSAVKIRLSDIPSLLSPTWSKKGFFSGKNALELLNEHVDIENIESLPKRFAAVSADLRTSEVVVFTEGNLKNAIRASIAIPVLFTPVSEGQQLLVDGGTLEPVPVSVARGLGADIVIAVDLFGHPPVSPEEEQEEEDADSAIWPKGSRNAQSYLQSLSSKLSVRRMLPSQHNLHDANILSILESTLAVSQNHLTRARLKEHPADFLIQPKVSKVGLLDFHRGEPAIELGFKAAEKIIPELKKALDQ